MTAAIRDLVTTQTLVQRHVASSCNHVYYRVVTDNVGTITSTLPNRHCPNCGLRLTPATLASFDEDRALFERLLKHPPTN
jgi:hypothetical protein